jgi:hypothetical protein
MDPYGRREGNFERQLMEAVIETTYRRLIRHRGIGISLGGLHNMVAHTDLDKLCDEQVNTSEVISVMADGTALKQYRGSRVELRVVLGVSTSGRVVPLGCFANTPWGDIERHIRAPRGFITVFGRMGWEGLKVALTWKRSRESLVWSFPGAPLSLSAKRTGSGMLIFAAGRSWMS